MIALPRPAETMTDDEIMAWFNKPTYNKYRNRKVKADGYTFDSQAEYRRYCELKLLLEAGEISELRVHPKYQLLPSFTDSEGHRVRGIRYEADFEYVEAGHLVVEDVKGAETQVFKNKKKMLLYKYRDYPGFVFRQTKA
jgi:hypothetical protein